MQSDIGYGSGALPPAFAGFGLGHVTFADSQTELEANAVTIPGNTRTLLSIDGLGTQTETRWRGTLPADVWAGNTHRVAQNGQSWGVLVEFSVRKVAVSTDAVLTFEQDIGSDPLGASSIPIFTFSTILTKAAGVAQGFSKSWSGYGKETFLANGAKYFLTCPVDIQIWGAEIFIEDHGAPRISI